MITIAPRPKVIKRMKNLVSYWTDKSYEKIKPGDILISDYVIAPYIVLIGTNTPSYTRDFPKHIDWKCSIEPGQLIYERNRVHHIGGQFKSINKKDWIREDMKEFYVTREDALETSNKLLTLALQDIRKLDHRYLFDYTFIYNSNLGEKINKEQVEKDIEKILGK